MLICNQVNYIVCDPECPHGKPHEATPIVYETRDDEYGIGSCDKAETPCRLRDESIVPKCVEVKCPATK